MQAILNFKNPTFPSCQNLQSDQFAGYLKHGRARMRQTGKTTEKRQNLDTLNNLTKNFSKLMSSKTTVRG